MVADSKTLARQISVICLHLRACTWKLLTGDEPECTLWILNCGFFVDHNCIDLQNAIKQSNVGGKWRRLTCWVHHPRFTSFTQNFTRLTAHVHRALLLSRLSISSKLVALWKRQKNEPCFPRYHGCHSCVTANCYVLHAPVCVPSRCSGFLQWPKDMCSSLLGISKMAVDVTMTWVAGILFITHFQLG